MLRIIHKAADQTPTQRSPSRREKALAWMQQQQEADRIKALEKHSERMNGLNKKTR